MFNIYYLYLKSTRNLKFYQQYATRLFRVKDEINKHQIQTLCIINLNLKKTKSATSYFPPASKA